MECEKDLALDEENRKSQKERITGEIQELKVNIHAANNNNNNNANNIKDNININVNFMSPPKLLLLNKINLKN